MPRLAALVVTCNRLDQLRVTVERLLAAPAETLCALVVVDNASDDGSAAWLGQVDDPRLDVLRLEHNSGGAGGFAAGLDHIRASDMDPDWTVLMDDDARPNPDCLDRFIQTPRQDAEIWFAAAYLPDGTIADMNRPWTNPFWHPRTFLRSLFAGRDGFHLSAGDYDAKAPCPVDGGSFVGLFLSREALAAAGLPDAGLFLYGDDVLYTLGFSARGGRCLFDPALTFEHDCKTLVGAQPTFAPLWKAYYFHRNQILVYRLAAGPVLFWPVLALKWVKWRLRARHYSGAGRRAYKRVLAAAVADGLRHNTNRPHSEIQQIAGQ